MASCSPGPVLTPRHLVGTCFSSLSSPMVLGKLSSLASLSCFLVSLLPQSQPSPSATTSCKALESGSPCFGSLSQEPRMTFVTFCNLVLLTSLASWPAFSSSPPVKMNSSQAGPSVQLPLPDTQVLTHYLGFHGFQKKVGNRSYKREID